MSIIEINNTWSDNDKKQEEASVIAVKETYQQKRLEKLRNCQDIEELNQKYIAVLEKQAKHYLTQT